jgi:hypothetical protein
MPVTDEKLTQCIGRLGLLAHFPLQNRFAIEEVAKILNETCATDEEATKAVDNLLANNNAWPGPMALRNAPPRKTVYFKPDWL